MTMGINSLAPNLSTVDAKSRVQMAVAGKMLETAESQGEAMVSMVESASESMEQAADKAASSLPGLGGKLDVSA